MPGLVQGDYDTEGMLSEKFTVVFTRPVFTWGQHSFIYVRKIIL